MIVKSEKYLSLLVVGIVKFEGGEAEVNDPATIERLRNFAHMGVVVPEAEKPAPKRSRSPKAE